MARNYIRHMSIHGPDYEYQARNLDEQVNLFLKDNPKFKLKSVTPMGGDMNDPKGEQFLVTFEAE